MQCNNTVIYLKTKLNFLVLCNIDVKSVTLQKIGLKFGFLSELIKTS